MAKRIVEVQFIAHVTVTQEIEVDTELTDEEIVAGLNGDGETDLCTGLLEYSELWDIDASKAIGRVVASDFEDGEYHDFELVKG